MAIQVVILLIFLSITVNLDQGRSMDAEVITTTSGKIRGIIQASSLPGIRVQKFLNIPYAEPPVGELRFEKPQPRKAWNGTLNSTEKNIACFQKYISGGNITEDCLILNVWTPYPQPKNATVMVYIHGGSFRSGSGSGSQRHNGANFVAVGDVILVTINYRLSALGFLSIGEGRLKGNLGLYDQRLAMKWVKENIASFGGNRESITLFGLSAGAVCISAHTVSEESWKYFDRVILQSGNMLMPWSLPTEEQSRNATNAFLKLVNCKNDERVLKCLKTLMTHDDLEKIYSKNPNPLDQFWYTPTVDREFLKENPLKSLMAGNFKKAGIIIGVTKDEMFYAQKKILQLTRNVTTITQQFKNLLKKQFKVEALYETAFELYKPECTPTFVEALRPMVDVQSDYFFVCATRREAILRSNMSSEVYLYRYSYATPVPYSAYPRGNFGFAAHGTDFLSSFGATINNEMFPAEDQILAMRVILYWTNFAKTGYKDPNSGTTKLPLILNNVATLPRWPKHSSSDQEYLDMESLSRMVVRKKLREKYCKFLENPSAYTTETKAKSSSSRDISHLVLLVIALLYSIL